MLSCLPSVQNLSSDSILNGFLEATSQKGIELYPAQEEAILEIMSGKNLILSTPTGSGKSLVASAMHFKAIAEGKRSYYTCPIKALVSEKFFALCDDFGPENVGMLTSDASINRDAPIMCVTAEILSNMALSEAEKAPVEYAIVDEFHYYSDPERGIAWQIPLLTLKNTTFLLMSATLGDESAIVKSLEELNHKKVAVVKSRDRPVPLDFEYKETPVHETLYELISAHKFPVYMVNFTQRECTIQAQNAMSVNFCTKEEKKQIQEQFGGFKFDTPFGKEIRRYLSHGIGLHHAGLLPKYRLLVEKLAQTGLLKIIMGTDTLGVGVNIPIRTVLFTQLCKFDGQKVGILSIRSFKQIAGRAGRKGFDEQGSVACQAPEHVIENKRSENRFATNDKAKKKKSVKKSAPTKNYVAWDEKTFQRLIDQEPESLTSQFWISHSLIITLLQQNPQNSNQGYKRLVELIKKSHETKLNKSKHRKSAATLFHALIKSNIVVVNKAKNTKSFIAINNKLQLDFSLHHTLSLYLVNALNLLENIDENYALDILTLVESIAESPKVILQKQIDKLKTTKMAEMKADGLDFDARIEELEKVEHPKPLRDFIYNTFNDFSAEHPWVGDENIAPKSIAREMIERDSTFNEYVLEYGLEKVEGLLLRYLSTVYKILIQTVPEQYKTDAVYEIIASLRNIIANTDSSLVAEWEQMLKPVENKLEVKVNKKPVMLYDPKTNPRAFYAKIRADMHGLVKALSRKNYPEALLFIRQKDETPLASSQLENYLSEYYENYDKIIFDPRAKHSEYTIIEKITDESWTVRQVILDPEGNNDWVISGTIEIDEKLTMDQPIVYLSQIHN
ncbi:MAG: DUF3516 domain-containing protein [bacterium]|nr:DUF3516 domain-containing protein [bacterium]